jgi:hypothetical protein
MKSVDSFFRVADVLRRGTWELPLKVADRIERDSESRRFFFTGAKRFSEVILFSVLASL